MNVVEEMRGSLHTALNHGHTTGRIAALDGSTWHCWAWERLGPQWIALAAGDGPSEPDARTLAEERLADEVAKQAALVAPASSAPVAPGEDGER